MFTVIKTKKLEEIKQREQKAVENEQLLLTKVSALEAYFDVKFYNGSKYKPHYRRKIK